MRGGPVGGVAGASVTQPVAISSAPAAGAVSEPTPAVPVAPAAAPSVDELQAAIEKIATAIRPAANDIEFSIDRPTGQTVVRVVDGQTGELIRQIPSEEVMAIARSIDKMRSLLPPSKA